jgi:hypothetical protein
MRPPAAIRGPSGADAGFRAPTRAWRSVPAFVGNGAALARRRLGLESGERLRCSPDRTRVGSGAPFVHLCCHPSFSCRRMRDGVRLRPQEGQLGVGRQPRSSTHSCWPARRRGPGGGGSADRPGAGGVSRCAGTRRGWGGQATLPTATDPLLTSSNSRWHSGPPLRAEAALAVLGRIIAGERDAHGPHGPHGPQARPRPRHRHRHRHRPRDHLGCPAGRWPAAARPRPTLLAGSFGMFDGDRVLKPGRPLPEMAMSLALVQVIGGPMESPCLIRRRPRSRSGVV